MSQQPPSIFTQHSRYWQSNHFVYPVISRRSRGLSIGINLNPDKSCNYDCVYCCVDRRIPPTIKAVDLSVVGAELEAMLGLAASGELYRHPPLNEAPPAFRRLNDVAFSGDGEPTACKLFLEACRLVAAMLEKHGQREAKIIVITNATLLDRPNVRDALAFLDDHNGEIWAKLDAGTEEYHRQIERTTIPLSRVLANILNAGRVRPIVIQSLFMRVHGKPVDAAEIDAYVQRLRKLGEQGCRIKLVQVYTVADPAESFVTPLEEQHLADIAAKVRFAGLSVETYQ